ncbi:Condensin complex subunit 2 [Danaus plexippus plexippus]|uniref:Condensin complex subunit 2 n=1 Tax=Danaus plexippus plexippus TaxID=278856 RepID=A0A212FP44_DANPL|nr:Condensin complex subunit 2 [Danaus plexippus plexippus]
MIESPLTSTPAGLRLSVGGRNSPLKRRSLVPQSRVKNIRDEDRNDDDAERSSLVASERALAASTPQSSPRRGKDTMSSSPQKEHFQGCLKLFAENKITKDNAWNLQLIDFMTSMLRRHDARMDNLQTASTVVDASTRIYSFRVDAVHYDVLKMAGGLNPFFERLAATTGDVTSSNRAFNATLPIHDETLALILRTDIPFLESIKENVDEEILDLNNHITLSLKLLPAFNENDKICEPFADFSISNWDPETEDRENPVSNWMEENRLNLSQQALAFDVNAEVEPIPQDDQHNDLFEDEPLGGIESDEEADVAVAACVARHGGRRGARLTDLRPAAPSHSRMEYSYCAPALAWAGPAHWRIKSNRASKQSERSQSTARATVECKKVKTKRQLDFLEAGLAVDWRTNPGPDFEPAQPAKIMISRKTLATGHTWNEYNYKTPVDRGLDESHFRKLFLRSTVMMTRARDAKEEEPLTVETSYDFNNENDASYCLKHVPEGAEWGNEDNTEAPELHERIRQEQDNEDIGDMIEPPTKVAKIFIPYAMRAKKVDMKQLKHCTWKMLTGNSCDGDKEEVSKTTFFSIYSKLPNKLSTNMKESLSIPLALLSVLHLANEKGLILEKKDDLKDIGIVGLIKN